MNKSLLPQTIHLVYNKPIRCSLFRTTFWANSHNFESTELIMPSFKDTLIQVITYNFQSKNKIIVFKQLQFL